MTDASTPPPSDADPAPGLSNPPRLEPFRFVLGLVLLALAVGLVLGILEPRAPPALRDAVGDELSWRQEVIYAREPEEIYQAYARQMAKVAGGPRTLRPGEYALGWGLALLLALGGIGLVLFGLTWRERVPALCPHCGQLVLARRSPFRLVCPKGQHDVGGRPGHVIVGAIAVLTAGVLVVYVVRVLV